MIEAIVFDFGNVIYRFDRELFLTKLAPHTDISLEELFTRLYGSDIPGRYETGAITSDEFFLLTCKRCGVSIPRDAFIEAFNSMFTPIPGMSELIRSLNGRYRLGLLSNTNEWHFEHTMRRADVFELFESVTLSYRVGEMKPAAGIYRDALGQLNLPPQRCVYVDDVREYALAAADIGMKGIHFTTRESLIESLRELGVTVFG